MNRLMLAAALRTSKQYFKAAIKTIKNLNDSFPLIFASFLFGSVILFAVAFLSMAYKINPSFGISIIISILVHIILLSYAVTLICIIGYAIKILIHIINKIRILFSKIKKDFKDNLEYYKYTK